MELGMAALKGGKRFGRLAARLAGEEIDLRQPVERALQALKPRLRLSRAELRQRRLRRGDFFHQRAVLCAAIEELSHIGELLAILERQLGSHGEAAGGAD